MNEPTSPSAEASEQKLENPPQSKLNGKEQLAQSHQEQIISAQANSINAIELREQVRPLKFRFIWAYWTLLVGAACTCSAAMAYLHAHAANAIVVFCLWGGAFVSITALNNLIWLNKVKRSFAVVNFKDIEVTWLLHTNSFNRGFRVEAIINKHLVVPISESINEFDKSVFNDLSTSPQSTRRALFIPGSSVPALIDTGNHYIWLKVPSGMTTIWKAAILTLLLCCIGIHW